jgi:hypothetical protein
MFSIKSYNKTISELESIEAYLFRTYVRFRNLERNETLLLVARNALLHFWKKAYPLRNTAFDNYLRADSEIHEIRRSMEEEDSPLFDRQWRKIEDCLLRAREQVEFLKFYNERARAVETQKIMQKIETEEIRETLEKLLERL